MYTHRQHTHMYSPTHTDTRLRKVEIIFKTHTITVFILWSSTAENDTAFISNFIQFHKIIEELKVILSFLFFFAFFSTFQNNKEHFKSLIIFLQYTIFY